MNIHTTLHLLTPEQLKQLDEEAKKGTLQALIKLKSHIPQTKQCAVCGQKVEETEGYKLEFGPSDLRMRAYCCALDCLEYFLTNLKKRNNGEGEDSTPTQDPSELP